MSNMHISYATLCFRSMVLHWHFFLVHLRGLQLKSVLAVCSADNFQDQMKRELSYREEMVQQLHIVRGETNKAKGAHAVAFHPHLSL